MTYLEVVATATVCVGLLVAAWLVAFVAWTFVRSLSARLMPGKWPHQDKEAKDIFDDRP